MNYKYFLSDNIKVLAEAVKQAVARDRGADYKKDMRQGLEYYDGKHDILNYKLLFVDNEGQVREEKARSNIKIPHQFFTELVDQKTQYLLSNPVEVRTAQKGLQNLLDEYIDEDFQNMLQEIVEGASIKSHEFIYINKEEKIKFNVADSLKIIEIHDDNLERVAVIRYYDTYLYKDGKNTRVTRAELWDKEKVHFFVNGGRDAPNFELDKAEIFNPRPHELLKNEITQDVIGRGLGYIPFLRFDNNHRKTNDLKPVKRLIDDYDLMACSLSNNLQDFDQPFFAVKGFDGGDYSTLINNLRSRGAVGTQKDGGLEVHTVNIPYDARKVKLEVDKEAIYKFGMGFDSSQIGDGNITNVVIKSRYSLLDLKCNKTEVRLRKFIKQLLRLIVDDINQRKGTSYDTSDLEIIITRDTMVNERDVSEIEQIEATVQQIKVNTIISVAAHLDDDTKLKLLCDALDLNYEEISEKVIEDQAVTFEGDHDGQVE